MTEFDQVIIKGLRIDMSAGIYDHEKQKTQPVIFDIVLDVESNKGRVLSSIDDVVSYEEIVFLIKEIALRNHWDLLEDLAEKICMECLSVSNKINAINLCIHKPEIIPEASMVGISIYRTRGQEAGCPH